MASSSDVEPGRPRIEERRPTPSTVLWGHLLRQPLSAIQPLAQPTTAPLVPSDKTNTSMRILLADTQANLEKFSARVDTMIKGVEEGTREIKTVGRLWDGEREGMMKDIVNLVDRCQQSIQNRLGEPSQAPKLYDLQKSAASTDRKIDGLERKLDALQMLNQTQLQTLQTLQEHHIQLLSALTPILPLLQAIPVHIDSAKNEVKDLTREGQHELGSKTSDVAIELKRQSDAVTDEWKEMRSNWDAWSAQLVSHLSSKTEEAKDEMKREIGSAVRAVHTDLFNKLGELTSLVNDHHTRNINRPQDEHYANIPNGSRETSDPSLTSHARGAMHSRSSSPTSTTHGKTLPSPLRPRSKRPRLELEDDLSNDHRRHSYSPARVRHGSITVTPQRNSTNLPTSVALPLARKPTQSMSTPELTRTITASRTPLTDLLRRTETSLHTPVVGLGRTAHIQQTGASATTPSSHTDPHSQPGRVTGHITDDHALSRADNRLTSDVRPLPAQVTLDGSSQVQERTTPLLRRSTNSRLLFHGSGPDFGASASNSRALSYTFSGTPIRNGSIVTDCHDSLEWSLPRPQLQRRIQNQSSRTLISKSQVDSSTFEPLGVIPTTMEPTDECNGTERYSSPVSSVLSEVQHTRRSQVQNPRPIDIHRPPPFVTAEEESPFNPPNVELPAPASSSSPVSDLHAGVVDLLIPDRLSTSGSSTPFPPTSKPMSLRDRRQLNDVTKDEGKRFIPLDDDDDLDDEYSFG